MTEQEKTQFGAKIINDINVNIDLRLSETTSAIIEAVSKVIDQKMQEFGVRQDLFEDKIVGLIKDLNSSHSQSENLRMDVETHENIIKTNILPRLDLLEKPSV